MAHYIQMTYNGRAIETVDEFPTRKEAYKMLQEYVMADPNNTYAVSTRPCKAWRDAK